MKQTKTVLQQSNVRFNALWSKADYCLGYLTLLFTLFVFSINSWRILCFPPWIYQTITIQKYECSNCHTLDISQEPMPPYNSTPCQFQWIHVHNHYIYIYIFLYPSYDTIYVLLLLYLYNIKSWNKQLVEIILNDSYNSFHSPHIPKKIVDSSIPLNTSFHQSIRFYQPPPSGSINILRSSKNYSLLFPTLR